MQIVERRLVLPARYHEEFSNGIFITTGDFHCLYAFTRDEFREFVESLRAASVPAMKIRIFFSSANEQMPKEDGGIIIPAKLCEYASLDGVCRINGMDKRLEIWNPERWDAYESGQEPSFADGPGD